MVKIKRILSIVIIVLLCVFVLYAIYLSLVTKKTYTDCGIIKNKVNDEITIKYGTRTNLIFIVDFEQSGVQEVDNLSTVTYMNYQKGDFVCFTLDKHFPLYKEFYIYFGIMSAVSICLIVVIIFIVWVFSPNKSIFWMFK